MPEFAREECYAMLREPGRDAIVATLRPDGTPHAVPVWYVVDGEDLVFTTWLTTVKARNLRANPHVALCISSPSDPTAYVLFEGEAEINETPAGPEARLMALIYERYGEPFNGTFTEGTIFVRVHPRRISGASF